MHCKIKKPVSSNAVQYVIQTCSSKVEIPDYVRSTNDIV